MLLFALGLMVFIFLAGILVGRAEWFPYPALQAAVDALQDWQKNWRQYLGIRSSNALATTRITGGVTVNDPVLAFDGYTFVTAYMPDGYNAYLLDMGGKIINRWDATYDRIWPNSELAGITALAGSIVHGAHLYANGDVLLVFIGLGMAKLDRCSNVVWKVDQRAHHQVEPLPGGGAIMAIREQHKATQGNRPLLNPGLLGYYWDDRILRVDPDGRVIDQHAIIDILYQSGWGSLMLSGPGSGKAVKEEDPLHLNDIETLSPELAPAFPMFEAGDLMISLRQLNTILVIDPSDWQVKWTMTGPFLAQHDPDFLPNGHILVYDNRTTGSAPRLGNSRLLEIDPATHKIVWSFDGKGDQQWYAEARGEQQLLPNGNILISDPYGGRLFEIAPAHGNRTVWEWVNLIQPGFVGLVTDAQRVALDSAGWIGKPCSEPAPVADMATR